ncbi:MAG: type II secretion system major pseudopilin GspG [Bacteroidota bacterium]
MSSKSRSTAKLHRQRGFTLIEIIVVMVILAILAAVIMPRFTGRTEQARRSRAIADIENISVSLDMYEADNGIYPTTEQGLAALREAPATDPVPANWRGPYLKKPLGNDPWGHPYVYQSPGDHNTDSYDLASYGLDGVEGGNGENADVNNWDLPEDLDGEE